MATRPRAGVYPGPVSLRPTTFGKALIIPLLLVAVSATMRDITLGPVFAIFAVLAVDCVLSTRGVGRRTISPTLVRAAVFSPERLALDLEVSAGPRALILPSRFAWSDHVSMEDSVLLDPSAQRVELKLSDGYTTTRRFARWAVMVTTLGLVQATRVDVAVFDRPAYRAPQRLDQQLVIEGTDEAGRLREYTAGDRQSRISWPTTARTGSLHVKDSLTTEGGDVCLVIDLGDIASFVEQGREFQELQLAMTTASSIAAELVEQGTPVRLITAELDERFWEDELDAAIASPAAERTSPVRNMYGSTPRDAVVTDLTSLAMRIASADLGWVDRPHVAHILVTLDGVEMVP